ncbi:unnamed protein product [Calicophoron daubneyi]|uniref:Cadherin domain-containing protein n=1 Tax=Calicophoron daubneyi TaxID=300641 RepID=A0AAV2TUQ9_CALDB
MGKTNTTKTLWIEENRITEENRMVGGANSGGRGSNGTFGDGRFLDRISCSSDGQVTIQLDINAVMPDASLRALHRASIRVHDVNDNWPKFEQVRWHKRLKEALYRKGRRLELPKARDADLLAEHSRIRYRLEPMESSNTSELEPPGIPFLLDVSKSGQPGLILTQDLDAETKERHRFVLVAYSPTPLWTPSASSWRAEDRTRKYSTISDSQRAESRMEIDIEVADMNDNEPKFSSSSYNVSVAEDTPPGTVIFRLVAHDPDSTARLTYSMGNSEEATAMSSVFTVEGNGQVRLRSFLDYEHRHTYSLPVEVNDGEFDDQAFLHVHVEDVNDEPPEFDINPKQLVADENASAGKLIGRVRIHDPDSQAVNGQIKCSEPSESEQQALSFHPDPTVNPTSEVYDLKTRRVLDREAVVHPLGGRLLVYLICWDGNDLGITNGSRTQYTSTMTATLTIRDVNDHPPEFTEEVYHVSILENNAIGEKIAQVHATDQDEGENGQITYTLLDRANFKVDSITGWVTANMEFDRESRGSYQVSVIATDQGNPRLSSSALLNLTVLDTNDHRPNLLPCEPDQAEFTPGRIQLGRVGQRNLFVVPENAPAYTYLGEVLAVDNDIGLNAEMKFELLENSLTRHAARFRLLENGSLFTAVELDREERDRYLLNVRVTDQSPTDPLSSTGSISIIVQDVNDNIPRFTEPQGLLSYELAEKISGSQSEIYVPDHNQSVDYPDLETMRTNSRSDGDEKRADGSINPTMAISLHEKPGFLITKLKAEDADIGENGRILYGLEEFSYSNIFVGLGIRPMLHVDSESGDVILHRIMFANDMGRHFFKVTAMDSGQPLPKADHRILVLLVEDIPPAKGKKSAVLASSYYSNNLTTTGWWSFNGRKNALTITLLVSVASLIAIVLVTAIICVMCSCSVRRRCGLGRVRQSRLAHRPVTSPGGSEGGNGLTTLGHTMGMNEVPDCSSLLNARGQNGMFPQADGNGTFRYLAEGWSEPCNGCGTESFPCPRFHADVDTMPTDFLPSKTAKVSANDNCKMIRPGSSEFQKDTSAEPSYVYENCFRPISSMNDTVLEANSVHGTVKASSFNPHTQTGTFNEIHSPLSPSRLEETPVVTACTCVPRDHDCPLRVDQQPWVKRSECRSPVKTTQFQPPTYGENLNTESLGNASGFGNRDVTNCGMFQSPELAWKNSLPRMSSFQPDVTPDLSMCKKDNLGSTQTAYSPHGFGESGNLVRNVKVDQGVTFTDIGGIPVCGAVIEELNSDSGQGGSEEEDHFTCPLLAYGTIVERPVNPSTSGSHRITADELKQDFTWSWPVTNDLRCNTTANIVDINRTPGKSVASTRTSTLPRVEDFARTIFKDKHA